MKKITKMLMAAVAISALATACTEEIDTTNYTPPPEVEVGESAYVVVTKVGDAYYYLTSESLSEGSVSVVGNGTEGNSITEYAIVNDILYTVADGGGSNPAPVYGYYLNASTDRIKQDLSLYYSTVKYEAWGQIGDNFVHLAPITYELGGETPLTVESVDYANRTTDDKGVITSTSLAGEYYPYYIGHSFSSTKKSDYVAADNFLGTGETVTFSGFAEAGDYAYVAVVPMYTLPWAVEKYRGTLEKVLTSLPGYENENLNSYIARGYGSQTDVNTLNGGLTTWANSVTPTSGIPFPLTVDSVYVAVYDKSVTDFKSKPIKIIRDGRMGASLCRRVRNPRPAMATGNNGDVYVFSPGGLRKLDGEQYPLYQNYTSSTTTDSEGNSTTNYSDPIDNLKFVKGEKGGSVMRIKNGATEFDETFGTNGVVDIEALIQAQIGDYAFTRVFHIGNNKFLLRIMDGAYTLSKGCFNTMHKSLYDTTFAVLDLGTDGKSASLTKVTGLPETSLINSSSASAAITDPYCENNIAYIPLGLAAGGAQVWVVDTNSNNYEATLGLEVNTDFIMGVGKLTAK